MKKKVTVAFSCIGRRVEMVRAFRSAYEQLSLEGRIIGFDNDSLAPALQLADRTCIVPPIHSEEYIPTMIEVCRQESVDALFPLIDTDIPLLSGSRSQFEAIGVKLAVVAPDAAAIAADKWLTKQFFERIQIRSPQSWLPDQFATESAAYPVLIKPRKGSAGKNVFVVRNSKEFAFFRDYVPEAMIQERLPGPEITSDVICGFDGKLFVVVSRKRLEVRSGEVSKGVTIFDPSIVDLCSTIARELPARGPITVQCMFKDGIPYFTEINARFGGGAPLGIAAGVNSPAMLLSELAGLPVDVPPPGSYRTSTYMTRYDDSFFLDELDREKISRSRI